MPLGKTHESYPSQDKIVKFWSVVVCATDDTRLMSPVVKTTKLGIANLKGNHFELPRKDTNDFPQ